MSAFVLKQRAGGEDHHLARAAIRPGTYLYGYCGGRFGRDSYGDKLVREVGPDHVVVEEDGVRKTSFAVSDWVKLLEDSNSWLEEHG